MYKLTVYVPSTSSITEYVNNEKYVRLICRVLSTIYGGCSTTPVEGYYVANNGELIVESVTCCYTFGGDAEQLARTGDYIAKWLKRVMKQESVLVTIEEIAQVSFV